MVGPWRGTVSRVRPGATPATLVTSDSHAAAGEPVGWRPDPEDPGPVGADAAGHRRALRTEPHDVLTRPDDPHRAAVAVGEPAGIGGGR